jgi:integrase/recombinase XerD
MIALQKTSKDYLQLRRRLGFKLRMYDWYLTQFVEFMKGQRASRITTELALRWATCSPKKTAAEQARRLSIVRGFAQYCSGLDPRTEIPPAGLLRGRAQRVQPYIYSDDEIVKLMNAARQLPSTVRRSPGLRAATYETLIGLLVVSGMRISEALHLDRSDIDWTERVLTIRETKWCKSRLVPLHPTTMRSLRNYAKRRDEICRRPKTASFFVDERWRRLGYYGVRATFVRLSRETGLRGLHDSRGPRMHDFRHRRAVCALIQWYREGKDVEQLLPVLSTYLGHVKVSDTYWYLTAVPELLQLAMARVEQKESLL